MKRQQFIHWYGGVAVAAMLSGAAAIGAAVASASSGAQAFKSLVASSPSSLAKQRARMAAKRPPPKNLAVSPAPRAAPPAAAVPPAAAAPPAAAMPPVVAVPPVTFMPGAAAAAQPGLDNPYLAYRKAQPEAAQPVASAPAGAVQVTAAPVSVPPLFPPWPAQPVTPDVRPSSPPVAVAPGAAAAMRPASGNPYLAYRQTQAVVAPPVTHPGGVASPVFPSWPSQPSSPEARPSPPSAFAPRAVAPPPIWALPPASPAPASVAPVTPPAVANAPSGSTPMRASHNPYLSAAPAVVDRAVTDAPDARTASESPALFSGVYLGGLQLVSPVRPPMDQAILPTFKKVYPTGDKPLMVVTFKCPTELVGVTPLPTKALHGLVDLGMGALNSSNLLPFNMQQVCQ